MSTKLTQICGEFANSTIKAKKCFKPYVTKRRKIFGIHLYRKIGAMRWNMDESVWNGVTFKEWETKIQKVVPIQFYIRYNLLPTISDYLKFLCFGYPDHLDNDRTKWKFVDYISSIEINYRNKIVDGLRSFYIRQIKDRMHPYNVIKISSIDRHYQDEETILIESMIHIFCSFLEQEGKRPEEYVIELHDGFDVNEYYREWAVQAWEIYDWAKIKNKNEKYWETRHAEVDKLIGTPDWIKIYTALEAEQASELEEMLIRIVKLRIGLWS